MDGEFMFRELINSIPFTLLITLFITLFVLITYLSASLSFGFFDSGDEDSRLMTTHSIMSILTGGFFVLLAFIIINAWTYMQEARSDTSKEATNLALIIRNSSAFPENEQRKIVKAAADYLVAVRVNEWATMRQGKESLEADKALDHLYITIQNYKPRLPHEKLYYSLITANMNGMIQARRERLNKIVSLIPSTLSHSIFFGAIFIAFILGVVRGKDRVFNLLPILLFSGLLGFNLALALSFDFPFSGDISVSNKVFYNGVLGSFPDH